MTDKAPIPTVYDKQQPKPATPHLWVSIPLPAKAGPKPLTIEEYRARQKKKVPHTPSPVTIKKKTKRGGKKQQLRKERKELHRLVVFAEGKFKNKLLHQLKELKNGKTNKQGGNNK